MTTSSLVRHGAGYSAKLLDGLQTWMARTGHDSVDGFRGMLAVPTDAESNAYQRAGYVAALEKAKSLYGSLV